MMAKFTVFVQESDGQGTIHIQTYEAKNVDAACNLARAQVRKDWGEECYTEDDLRILGVAEGEVKILFWEDLSDGLEEGRR